MMFTKALKRIKDALEAEPSLKGKVYESRSVANKTYPIVVFDAEGLATEQHLVSNPTRITAQSVILYLSEASPSKRAALLDLVHKTLEKANIIYTLDNWSTDADNRVPDSANLPANSYRAYLNYTLKV